MKKILVILFLQFSIVFAANQAVRKIFLVGDSTVTNYNASAYPMAGWGQVLQKYINPNVFTIVNRAIGGRSSRSFIEEGRWTSVKNEMVAGDFVFVQFGHNDRDFSKAERYTPPADYYNYIKQYVNEARAKGAIPVLVTPMVLNAWRNGALRNVFTESGAEYVQRMKQVASELNVPLIDLNQKSWDFVNTIGVDYATRFVYNTYLAGEYPNYPSGLTDYTHFQEMGALKMADFVVEGIQALNNHTDVGQISNALLAQYRVTVSSNVTAAGTITRSDSYPKDATVTLKALVNSGHTFLYWKNALTNTVVSTNNIYFFTMGTSSVSYIAVFDNDASSDCAGTSGGGAVLDNCGVCIGGNTGKIACGSSIQAETACEVDGVLSETSNGGFYGEGYVNTTNLVGSNAIWSFTSEIAQTTSASIRFANGGTTNRNMTLKVNDIVVGDVVFAPTGSFTTWTTVEVNLPLIQGGNKIELISITDGGGPNIDLFAFQNTTVITGGCSTDCSGLLGGTATIDDCGVCSGGGTGLVPNTSCVDCNGEINGTAVIDNCKICTGGSTGIIACSGGLQGEEVCAIDGILLESSNSGFLGEGYANSNNELGARMSFDIMATTSKNIDLQVRYANGGTASRDAFVFVNGSSEATLLLPITGAWTNWKTTVVNVSVETGTNEIVFEANSLGGLANIDIITWSDSDISFEGCPLETSMEYQQFEVVQNFPNPFYTTTTIHVSNESNYQILNVQGQVLESGKCTSSCKIGSSLEVGVYELIVFSNEKKAIQKIVKQ